MSGKSLSQLRASADQRLTVAQQAAAEAMADLWAHGIPVVYAEGGKVYRKRSKSAKPEYVRDLPDTPLVSAKRKK